MLRRWLREGLALEYWANLYRSRGRPDAVFLWVPKTAGTSVYTVLSSFGCYRLKTRRAVHRTFPQRGLVTFKHMSYRKLVEEDEISRTFDARAYKFAFVRNPYDRAVSLFHFLHGKGHHADVDGFLSFWQRIDSSALPAVGPDKVVGIGICNPQVRWLEGTKIDLLGTFERIDEDFSIVLEQLGLPRVALPRANATQHAPYRDYYCKESTELIERLFREDFSAFGYSTELESRSAPNEYPNSAISREQARSIRDRSPSLRSSV
jgi:hypothetical protein